MGGKKTLQPSFPILQLRTKLGLTESRHATRYPCTYTHTHTHVHAATRAEPILFPILYPSPGIYILPRWPPADVPFNAAKMLEEKFLVEPSPLPEPFSLLRTFSPARLFSTIPRGNIRSEYISDRPILYDYYYHHRRFAGQPPFSRATSITTATYVHVIQITLGCVLGKRVIYHGGA